MQVADHRLALGPQNGPDQRRDQAHGHQRPTRGQREPSQTVEIAQAGQPLEPGVEAAATDVPVEDRVTGPEHAATEQQRDARQRQDHVRGRPGAEQRRGDRPGPQPHRHAEDHQPDHAQQRQHREQALVDAVLHVALAEPDQARQEERELTGAEHRQLSLHDRHGHQPDDQQHRADKPDADRGVLQAEVGPSQQDAPDAEKNPEEQEQKLRHHEVEELIHGVGLRGWLAAESKVSRRHGNHIASIRQGDAPFGIDRCGESRLSCHKVRVQSIMSEKHAARRFRTHCPNLGADHAAHGRRTDHRRR